MLRPTPTVGTLVFWLMLQPSLVIAQEEDLSVDKRELHALAILVDSERVARRAHRTIERYRVYLKRIETKIADGVDRDKVTGGGMRRLIAMSNLAQSMDPIDRDVLWKITHGTLDLDRYIESDGEYTHRRYDDPYMEEMVVVGSIFDHMPMDPAEFSVDEIKIMRTERRKANELYRDGYYDEAYPLLLDLAQRGFKDSQSRLAYILFHGTNNVDKSNLRALGWLGTAAYGDSEPKFRVLFKRYMDEVPDNFRPIVNKVVSSYQRSYAHDEHQNCSTDHNFTDGSRIKKTYCRFRLETIAEACESGYHGGRCWAHAVNSKTE